MEDTIPIIARSETASLLSIIKVTILLAGKSHTMSFWKRGSSVLTLPLHTMQHVYR